MMDKITHAESLITEYREDLREILYEIKFVSARLSPSPTLISQFTYLESLVIDGARINEKIQNEIDLLDPRREANDG